MSTDAPPGELLPSTCPDAAASPVAASPRSAAPQTPTASAAAASDSTTRTSEPVDARHSSASEAKDISVGGAPAAAPPGQAATGSADSKSPAPPLTAASVPGPAAPAAPAAPAGPAAPQPMAMTMPSLDLLREILATDDDGGNLQRSFRGEPCTRAEMEERVEYLEMICGRLQHMEDKLVRDIEAYRVKQTLTVGPLLDALQAKSAALIDELKRGKAEETDLRQKIDALSQLTEKVKKTVKTAAELSLAPQKQTKEQSKLSQMRQQRDAAVSKLEEFVKARSLAEGQILNIGAVVSELRADINKRNYAIALNALVSSHFRTAFGPDSQNEFVEKVQSMSGYRQSSRECARKMESVLTAHQQIRLRVSHLVAAYWR